MKKLLKITLTLFITITIILGFALPVNMPPGWFQQTLPRTDNILRDIFFIDSFTGWSVGNKYPSNDTAFVFKTTNSGNNWFMQNQLKSFLNVIQFLDANIGYTAGGGNGSVFLSIHKTTNGGTNWIILNNLGGIRVSDLFFINRDTGWICDQDPTFGAGLQKTTNGGISWFQQLPRSFQSSKLFFISKDTGWAGTNEVNGRLFKTTNGGTNWNLQYTFSLSIQDIYFFNKDIGVITSSINQRTTNGGFNWSQTNGNGGEICFVNDSVGWAGNNFYIITKTIDGGKTWFDQTSPIFTAATVTAIDTNLAWAGGSGVIHTTDGGGPTGIKQISSEIPSEYKLYQNYPNPFNPTTNLKYSVISSSNVKIVVYDIQGREVMTLVNQKHSSGTYQVDFQGTGLASGVYFYSLITNGTLIDTRKMILLK